MPGFRARYTLWIDYVDSMGLGMNAANQAGQSFGPSSGATLQMTQQISPGSQTFTATDISNLLATMSTDLTTQMTANQARIQGFATGTG